MRTSQGCHENREISPGYRDGKEFAAVRENNAYLPALLRDSGYETGMAGKLHLFPADRDYGFEVRHLSDAPYSVYGNEDKYSEYIKWLRDNYFDAKGIDPVKIFDEDEASYDEDIKRFYDGLLLSGRGGA